MIHRGVKANVGQFFLHPKILTSVIFSVNWEERLAGGKLDILFFSS